MNPGCSSYMRPLSYGPPQVEIVLATIVTEVLLGQFILQVSWLVRPMADFERKSAIYRRDQPASIAVQQNSVFCYTPENDNVP